MMLALLICALLGAAASCAHKANAKTSPRAQLARKLNRGLYGTPMAWTGWKLEQAGHTWNIHPALIAAIAGTESSFGRAPCRNDRFNAFGLASCTNSWPVPRFRSWAHAYQFMGRFLSERWPSARTPYDLHGYAACSSCWAARVSWFMRHMGFPSTVRYPRAGRP